MSLLREVAESELPIFFERVLEKCGFEVVRTATVFDERLGAEIDEVLLELR
jgi:hypothetical protein